MSWPVLAILTILAGCGAWLDWHERRLPNWLCVATLGAGLAVTIIETGLVALPSHGLHAGLALVTGMALFHQGLIGGGDAKFYASVAAWFPLGAGFQLVFAVALAGLFLIAALWLLFWRDKPSGTEGQPRTVPYGVAIAVGAIALESVRMS